MMDSIQQEHLRWLEKMAKEARSELDQKKAKLEQLRIEVNEIEGDALRLERAVETVRRALGLPSSELTRTRFRDMTIRNAAEVAMKEAGGQMRVVDLIKALQEGGKELGERAYSVVTTTLIRDEDRFEKVGKGEYRLKETG